MFVFLNSFHAVELMRSGSNPTVAAALSIGRITKFFPSFSGAVIAVKMNGEYGKALNSSRLLKLILVSLGEAKLVEPSHFLTKKPWLSLVLI